MKDIKVVTVRDDLEKACLTVWRQCCGARILDGRTPPDRKVVHLDTASGQVVQLLMTRDEGMHTCGWWKNPDYERCYHLTLSFAYYSALMGVIRPEVFDQTVAHQVVDNIYGRRGWKKHIWEEGPSDPTMPLEVRHYRVFCDKRWEPITPRGEVYSRELTEKGWKSWSEVQSGIQSTER